VRFFIAFFLAFVCSGLCRADEITADVLREINFARTSPRAFAQQIAAERPPTAAVREAILFLQKVKPMNPLSMSEAICGASREHVADQSARGEVGHRGSDGSSPWSRLARFGKWSGPAGEAICYGRHGAHDAVLDFIVDEGVPDRGHRKNIFNSEFSNAGVAWGSHARYGTMCVVDFTGAFRAGMQLGKNRLASGGF
jgi:uncharacterized protein YkwD